MASLSLTTVVSAVAIPLRAQVATAFQEAMQCKAFYVQYSFQRLTQCQVRRMRSMRRHERYLRPHFDHYGSSL
jgi:hypothetical protein